MKILRVLASLMAVLSLSSCASVVAGTHKKIVVRSTPSGALIKLDGVTRALTPGVIHPSTRSDHLLTVELAGHSPVHIPLVRKYSAWNWGNVVTGFAPGIAFDAITGAVYSFHPDRVDVTFRPLEGK